MRLVPYASMAAFAALSCLASEGDGGADAAAAEAAAAEAAAKAAADQAAAEQAAKDKEAAEAAAAAAAAAAKTAKAPKPVFMVWCAPGHADFAVGMLVRATPDVAEGLRGAGKARFAQKGEDKALAGDDEAPLVG